MNSTQDITAAIRALTGHTVEPRRAAIGGYFDTYPERHQDVYERLDMCRRLDIPPGADYSNADLVRMVIEKEGNRWM